jgi:multidrug resistance efflux pump
VIVSLSVLIYGGYLIRANTPKSPTTAVEFAPPQSPDSSLQYANRVSQSISKRSFIGAIGIIEPVGEAISIGSQLSGTISQVCVTPGLSIKKGDPLFVLDDRSVRASIEVARVRLAAEEGKLVEMRGQIAPQKARVQAAEARLHLAESRLKYAVLELERAERLAPANAISVEELDQRRLNVAIAEAQAKEARALLQESISNLELLSGDSAAPTLDVQMIKIEEARANLSREETLLSLHTVTSPIDCQVLQVKVRPSEFVPAAVVATPLITLGIVDPLHVRVDIDETDIARFSSKSNAYASLRGRPAERCSLEFVRVEPYVTPKKVLSGNVSERVDTRVLQVVYAVDPVEFKAVPGQQVDVYIEAAVN